MMETMQENEKAPKKAIIAAVLLIGVVGIGYYLYVSRAKPAQAPSSPPPAARDQATDNFSKTGNLIRNNPGMKPGLWYLVFDEPGAPASSVELAFTGKSRCIIGSYDGACTESLLILGARVEVIGFRVGTQVFVHTYRQVDLEGKG